MDRENKRRSGFSEPSATVVAMSDRTFQVVLAVLGTSYIVLIILLIAADFGYLALTKNTSESRWMLILHPVMEALSKVEIRNSIILSLLACTASAILSLWVAVPLGYIITRHRNIWSEILDTFMDIPIVLPPLVLGVSLLILFQFWPFRLFARSVVYEVPAVIIAQFTVAAAYAVRTMKATFELINPRCEQVALTLGCTRAQAFGNVVLPQAGRGILTAFTLAWARSLGEFGPLLIFAGATRNKTEVLSTTVFLELTIGDLSGAVAVSLIMVFAAAIVLVIARIWGQRSVIL